MKKLTWLLLLLVVSLGAQTRHGVVFEAEHGNPIAFASVRCGDQLVFTDIDGSFLLQDSRGPIRVSVTGYKDKTVYASQSGSTQIRVYLRALDVGKSQNKANLLIARAISSRKSNDPQQALSSYKFDSYNKLLVTANPDSISGSIDSVFYFKYRDKKIFRKLDSSDYHFKKYISRQHLFLSEKVSRFEFDGEVLKENIKGARMGGFQQPVYELMALKLQSFSVYGEQFEMARVTYNGPLASDAFHDYEYRLQDSLRISGRKVYAIAFFPKKKRGISGLLYLDEKTSGVAQATIRFRGVIDITANYRFDYLFAQNVWFPQITEIIVAKGRYDRPISILGTTLDFEPESNTANQFAGRSLTKKRQKFASDFIYARSATWFSAPEVDVPVEIRHPWVRAEIEDQAVKRDEAYWKSVPKHDSDPRDEQSYRSLDSISGSFGLQWKLRLARRFLYGYIPLGSIDLRFTDIIAYNEYEGLRLGLGGITNEKFSKMVRIDGYGAYGFRDTRIKYSLGTALRLGKFSNSWIGVSYTDDIREIASTQFITDPKKIRIYDGRPFNITTFYSYKSWRGYVESRLIPKTESIWQLEYSHIDPLFDYTFTKDGQELQEYDLATAEVSLQWNPFSEYMQTPMGRIETDRGFPKFAFQYTQAVAGIFDSDLSFGKLDLRVEYEKDFLGGQKTTALLLGGYAYGDVPVTQLYNSTPNNPRSGNVLERIRPGSTNGFETMLFNEFFSSRYFSLQLRQTSQRFEISRSVKPSFGIVTRMAYGDLRHPEQHLGFDYKTLDKGYFESGIEINMIYSGLGLGCYYRYGANSLPQPSDNFSIKVNFKLDLGM
ncbi:DUF5686 family protein [Flavobacterium silvaticum]|uniref:Carboxypeptidase-like regulatory domain-containing protein n=1 Tax=Flavobacterium silvaticum TaxID=1852020 RepID=A0A972FM59_9FLAO|nr:DUF5686 family protein [Flavobacterium silvaticum]NMH28561.1 carboxypeptidase-like regulatory domain-containing protein [Flavobacterium silvaticum]